MGIIEKLGITPGPWEIKKHEYGYDKIGPIEHSGVYCDDRWIDVENEKTVSLIAASPEMLEALIGIINVDSDIAFMEAIKKAHDVATKATGKSWEEIKELL